jgi:hypothetical protein
MRRVQLLTKERAHVTYIIMPPVIPPPGVLQWNARYFVRITDIAYSEETLWTVKEPDHAATDTQQR